MYSTLCNNLYGKKYIYVLRKVKQVVVEGKGNLPPPKIVIHLYEC